MAALHISLHRHHRWSLAAVAHRYWTTRCTSAMPLAVQASEWQANIAARTHRLHMHTSLVACALVRSQSIVSACLVCLPRRLCLHLQEVLHLQKFCTKELCCCRRSKQQGYATSSSTVLLPVVYELCHGTIPTAVPP